MKTINIKGKEYITVHERIKYFRSEEKYTDYKIVNDFIDINEDFCVIKSCIINDKNEIVATGFAREVNGDSFINKTSYIENAETSAVGRALGNLGIGVDESFASADEVANAVNNKNTTRASTKTKSVNLQDQYKGKLTGYNTWGDAIQTEEGRDALSSYIDFCKSKGIEVKLSSDFEKELSSLEVGF